MSTMVDCSHSELSNPALRARHGGVPPAFLNNYRLREIASDGAMLVAVLAFVLAFVALRMTLFASPEITERVAIPAAIGGGVVFVLSLLGALALRHGDAP